MEMIPQGSPLYATTDHPDWPGVWGVVGWVAPPSNMPALRPVVVPIDRPARNAVMPGDEPAWTFTTSPATDTLSSGAPARIYGMPLPEIADELVKADDLRDRMNRLADDLERSYPNYGAASHAVQRIREELSR